jgi:hypothetical protein
VLGRSLTTLSVSRLSRGCAYGSALRSLACFGFDARSDRVTFRRSSGVEVLTADVAIRPMETLGEGIPRSARSSGDASASLARSTCSGRFAQESPAALRRERLSCTNTAVTATRPPEVESVRNAVMTHHGDRCSTCMRQLLVVRETLATQTSPSATANARTRSPTFRQFTRQHSLQGRFPHSRKARPHSAQSRSRGVRDDEVGRAAPAGDVPGSPRRPRGGEIAPTRSTRQTSAQTLLAMSR